MQRPDAPFQLPQRILRGLPIALGLISSIVLGLTTDYVLQLVNRPARDVEIPGAGYSFGTLIAAQSAGDLQTLRGHGLPAERVELEGEPAQAVRELTERIKGVLG